MDYKLTVGDGMLGVLNLTVEYYDADGKVQTEVLTAKEWKKSVRAKLPTTLGARLKVQLKDGIDPAAIETFTAAYGYSYNGYAVSATDKVVGNVVNRENHRKDTRDVERQYADAYVGLPTDGECVGMVVESCCVDFLFEKLQALFFGDGDTVQM